MIEQRVYTQWGEKKGFQKVFSYSKTIFSRENLNAPIKFPKEI